MKEIILTKNQVAIVDDEMFESLNEYRWAVAWRPTSRAYYVRERSRNGIYMHRLITNAPRELQVDHINGNTLDNRKSNLRLVTNRQNQQNQHRPKSSIYPGVNFDKKTSKWRAKIQINKKKVDLGCHINEIDAFLAYLSACKRFGFPVENMVEKHLNQKILSTGMESNEEFVPSQFTTDTEVQTNA